MAKRKRQAEVGEKSGAPRDDSGNESTADRARGMADRIEQVANVVVRSFKSSDPKSRQSAVRENLNEILFGMAPVISWLERRRPPGTAQLVRDRLRVVLDEALACAAHHILEYAGGMFRKSEGAPSEGAQRTAALRVTAKMLADSLRDWAKEIEVDLGVGSPQKPKARRGRPPDTDKETDKRIAEAWDSGRYESLDGLANEFRVKKIDVTRALDRHRHRRQNGPT
jgi:hypothetical protein